MVVSSNAGALLKQNLHGLRRTVYRAARDYYAARAKYFRARLASPAGAALLTHREECLVRGQLYRTASELLIAALNTTMEASDDELPRQQHMLALLDTELRRMYAEAPSG